MTDMHELERNWWAELANQYEEWAENPPRDRYGYELHTCTALLESEFGWSVTGCGDTTDHLRLLWCWKYGNTDFPAGETHNSGRDKKRFEFCHWQAEAIRDYLEEGRGPWEDEG